MTNKDKQDRAFKIPMEVTPETIRDFEIDPKDVTWTRIGNKAGKGCVGSLHGGRVL